jgi:hypothetical protein
VLRLQAGRGGLLTLLDDRAAREALFDGTDAELATLYRRMDSADQSEAFAFNGWEGFEDPRLESFADSAGDCPEMNAQTTSPEWDLPFFHDPIHQRWRENLMPR